MRWLGFTQIKCKPEAGGGQWAEAELWPVLTNEGPGADDLTNPSSLISLPGVHSYWSNHSPVNYLGLQSLVECSADLPSVHEIKYELIELNVRRGKMLHPSAGYNNENQINHWELNFSDQTSEANLISDM